MMNPSRADNTVSLRWVRLFLPLFLLLFCGACSLFPEEEEGGRVSITHEESQPLYELSQVERKDVVLSKKVYCTYSQSEGEDLYFATSGRKVAFVKVRAGENVVKGQLLAGLEIDDLLEDIEELDYQVERYELLLLHKEQLEAYDLAEVEATYLAGESTQDRYEEQVKEIKERYERETRDLKDSLSVAKMRRSQLLTQKQGSLIYAGMDGRVSYAAPNLAGSYPKEGQRIISLVDGEDCAFYMNEEDYADYFAIGDLVQLQGSEASYEAVVERGGYDAEGNFVPYALYVDETLGEIPVGTRAVILLTIDERKDVLTLPSNVIHIADGQSYVYVEKEDGFKTMQYIETGLSGDGLTEIIRGLSEGDLVIRK